MTKPDRQPFVVFVEQPPQYARVPFIYQGHSSDKQLSSLEFACRIIGSYRYTVNTLTFICTTIHDHILYIYIYNFIFRTFQLDKSYLKYFDYIHFNQILLFLKRNTPIFKVNYSPKVRIYIFVTKKYQMYTAQYDLFANIKLHHCVLL